MKNNRGFTLVELMIVVAILGILAALGSIAYGKYITNAKMQKLEQWALEVQSGQERFKSRNNVYWDGGTYVGNEDDYANLIDFAHTIPTETSIETEAWDGAVGTCTICAGAPFDDSRAGFAVRIEKDFKTGGVKTTYVITTDTASPILINEGE